MNGRKLAIGLIIAIGAVMANPPPQAETPKDYFVSSDTRTHDAGVRDAGEESATVFSLEETLVASLAPPGTQGAHDLPPPARQPERAGGWTPLSAGPVELAHRNVFFLPLSAAPGGGTTFPPNGTDGVVAGES